MRGMLAEIQLFLLAGIGFLALAAVVGIPLARMIERATRSWFPAARHSALLVAAALPLVTAASALIAAVLPSAVLLALTGSDHCLGHDDHHAHLCPVHLPEAASSGVAWLFLAIVLAWPAARLVEGLVAVGRARSLLTRLISTAAATLDGRALVVPSSQPLCVTAGLLAPKVVVSEGFLVHAEPLVRKAALFHEEAHVRRRDSLRRLFARAASVVLPPRTRRLILAEIDVAAERACDEEATQRIGGDRLRMAEAILAVEKLLGTAATPGAPSLSRSVGTEAVPRRIESLLEPRSRRGSTALIAALLAVVVMTPMMAHDWVHHVAEWLLSFGLHTGT